MGRGGKEVDIQHDSNPSCVALVVFFTPARGECAWTDNTLLRKGSAEKKNMESYTKHAVSQYFRTIL